MLVPCPDTRDGNYRGVDACGHVREGALPHKGSQLLFVLSGELTLIVDGATVVIGENHGLEIAPGKIHKAANRGSSPVRFLVASSQPSHPDRIDL
jgi:mannose-6-phosphate isomerase-like protein (cupin superfamily)